jgi:DHA2 family multidrug resistance protein-like MFS transporter
MALLLVLGPIVLPEYRDENAGRLDLISAVMSLVAVLSMIFGLKQIAQDGIGWLPVSSVLVGLVVGALFVRRQLTLADPMIDLRLFRIPAFTASLAINFLAIFVAIGYFLFVAQYLQLVVGLSPLEAGFWSVPSAVGFIVGSNAAPRIVRHVRAAYVMGAGLALAAIGLAVLTQVGATDGLATVIAGSIIISLGLAPVLSLTTELIVGSAPPERAGAASGISETGAELGGALGISILGSIGVALYRGHVAAGLPAGVPADAAAVARDTLGGAVAVAGQLPGHLGSAVLDVARDAFVQGMQLAATISAVLAVAVAILAVVMLRNVGSGEDREAAADAEAEQARDFDRKREMERASAERRRHVATVPEC